MATGRPKVLLQVTASERLELQAVASSRSLPHGLVRPLGDGYSVALFDLATATPSTVSFIRRANCRSPL